VLTDERGTTNLTVSDRWGNVVEYTLTIEATGGNAMVVPGRGFLLNNELTDFNFTPTQGTAADPNLPAPGKRPRSSMAPTILLRHGKPFLATGSPGGATIITTVFQILVNRIDLDMTLPEAIAAPRASQRNAATGQAEPAFLASAEAAELQRLGHGFASSPEIGAATGLEFLPDGQVLAAAEPARRGGGSAAVVRPSR
jgi:gamma-glutamyltranspeptidase/glutathione hydrolase